jgi:dTDP-4-amino-4,6-dideoxygalactose transaminase
MVSFLDEDEHAGLAYCQSYIVDESSNILSKECVIIPSSPNLKIEEQIYVVQQIVEYLKEDMGEQNYEEIKEYITDFE